MKNTHTEHLSTDRTPTVLPAFAELLPPLPEEQLALLETDILQNGCYSPIIVNEDLVVIDGHNRLSICQMLGEDGKRVPKNHEDAQSEVNDIGVREAFIDGFRLGARLTLAALSEDDGELRPLI